MRETPRQLGAGGRTTGGSAAVPATRTIDAEADERDVVNQLVEQRKLCLIHLAGREGELAAQAAQAQQEVDDGLADGPAGRVRALRAPHAQRLRAERRFDGGGELTAELVDGEAPPGEHPRQLRGDELAGLVDREPERGEMRPTPRIRRSRPSGVGGSAPRV